MRALRSCADALVSALFLVVVESLLVSLVFHRELAGAWELRQALRVLPAIGWVTVAPLAIVGALLLAGMRRGADRPVRIGLVLAAVVFGALVGVGVTGGRHFASMPLRVAFVAVLALGAGATTYALAPRLASVIARVPARVGAGALAGLAVLELANALVLPRLYPAFHAGLAALAVLFAPLLALLFRDRDARTGKTGAPTLAFVLGVAALLTAAGVGLPRMARSLERADNVRFLFADRAPVLRYAVTVIAALAPPPEDPSSPSSPDAAVVAGGGAPGGTAAVDLRGRDIVLVSVDALRADHVGAYGYARPTTPNLDALAREGVVFSHAYCATPHTSYSVASMMTGKYMRPLVLQGAGDDSDTLAKLLRTYGYRTAAFYPPAVFFIDAERFTGLRDRGIDFEYRRVEFASADKRAEQVEAYLARVREGRRVLLWVHLFEPHEPYERHDGIDFGDRDLDRYDGEVAATDAGIGKIVAAIRKRRPEAVIILTSDHGEEFGEHGGRYHGTTVYEEQTRVPLIVVAPGLLAPARVDTVVQTVDVLPTVLSGLAIPRPARVRGRDLTPHLAGKAQGDPGLAFAETDEATLLAEGPLRLVCARRVSACQLFDVSADPRETRDVTAEQRPRFDALKKRLRDIESAHGKLERAGLRAEGKAWPDALRRGMAGDADAAPDVAALLDDADVTFRRKAAEVLFDLARKETADALRLSVTRDEDDVVKRYAALALTRMGEGAGRSLELVDDKELAWRRLAAFALAEAGDGRGEGTLVAWLESREAPFERTRELVRALGRIRSKRAIVPLTKLLPDVRLRPTVAEALAEIGESAARPALQEAFAAERYAPARRVLGAALIRLGASSEIAAPLTRFLGVPDPLEGGVGLAERGGFLAAIGGPDKKELPRLRSTSAATFVVPVLVPSGGNGKGARLIVRGNARGAAPAVVQLGVALARGKDTPLELDPRRTIAVTLPPGEPTEVFVDLPAAFGVRVGPFDLVVHRGDDAALSALAIVPLADELPPPPPEPWTPSRGDQSEDVVDDGT